MHLSVHDGGQNRYPTLGIFPEDADLYEFITTDGFEYSNMPLFNQVIEFQLHMIPRPIPAGGDGIMHDCFYMALLTAFHGRNPPWKERGIFNAATLKQALGVPRDGRIPADRLSRIDDLLGNSVRLEVTGDVCSYMSPAGKCKNMTARVVKLTLIDAHWELHRNAPFWGFSASRWNQTPPENAKLYDAMVGLAPKHLKYIASQIVAWYAKGGERSLPLAALAYNTLTMPEPEPLTGQEEIWIAMATRTALMTGEKKTAAAQHTFPGSVVQKFDVVSAYPAAACSRTRLPVGEGEFKIFQPQYFDTAVENVRRHRKEDAFQLSIVRIERIEWPSTTVNMAGARSAPVNGQRSAKGKPRLFRLPSSRKTHRELNCLPGEYYTRSDLIAAIYAGAIIRIKDDGRPNMLSWPGRKSMMAHDIFGWMRNYFDLRTALKAAGRPDLAAPVKLCLNGVIGSLARKKTLKRSVKKIIDDDDGLLPGTLIGGQMDGENFEESVLEFRGQNYYRFPVARFAPFIQSYSRANVAAVIRAQMAASPELKIRRVYVDGWTLEGTRAQIDLATAALPSGGPSSNLGAVKLE